MAKCKRKCRCVNCENFMEGEIVLISRGGFLSETREFVQGYHCTYYGGWSRIKNVKNPEFDDDFVYL